MASKIAAKLPISGAEICEDPDSVIAFYGALTSLFHQVHFLSSAFCQVNAKDNLQWVDFRFSDEIITAPEDSATGGAMMLFLVSKNMFRQQIGALNSSGLVSQRWVILECRIVSSALCSSDVRAWWFDSCDINRYLKPNYRVLV